MGNCIDSNKNILVTNIAIKLPGTTEYIYYDDETKKFIYEADINVWLNNLYCLNNSPNYIVYNNDTSLLPVTNKNNNMSNCKGIVTWNKNRISWLVHTMPNFPRNFVGNYNNRHPFISQLERSNMMYGHMFHHIEFNFNKEILDNILQHLTIMDANIYINKYEDDFIFPKINITKKFYILKIDDNIIHIAKSSNYNIDIYGEYIAREPNTRWDIRTSTKSNLLIKSNSNINKINNIMFDTIVVSSTDDYSNWGISDSWYCVCDLDISLAQYSKGGGVFISSNKDIITALRKLIKQKDR